MGTQLPLPQRGTAPPFSTHICCGQIAPWINMRFGTQVPGDFVLDGNPRPLPKKGADPTFLECLLWPNGWMDQGGTWHGGRPQPRRLCVRWGPSPFTKRRRSPTPQISAHFHCGQTAGCIKMPFGTEVGLIPGDFVLDGDQLSSPKRRPNPSPTREKLRPMFIVAKRLDGSRWHSAWRQASAQATLC